jgi:hypothetical protein
MYMSNKRPNIPLNDCVLSTFRAGIEVNCEPPGVHVHRLPILLICWDVRGSKANRLSNGVPPPGRRHHPTNRRAIDGKTKDHGDVLQRHRDLAIRKVERVGLRTPPVHKCHQRGGVHQWQTTIGEPSKRQDPCTMYERLIPLIPRQGAMRADPERLQTLSNTTTVQKYYPHAQQKITNSVKYIKPNVHTYHSLLSEETSSMLVVPVCRI